MGMCQLALPQRNSAAASAAAARTGPVTIEQTARSTSLTLFARLVRKSARRKSAKLMGCRGASMRQRVERKNRRGRRQRTSKGRRRRTGRLTYNSTCAGHTTSGYPVPTLSWQLRLRVRESTTHGIDRRGTARTGCAAASDTFPAAIAVTSTALLEMMTKNPAMAMRKTSGCVRCTRVSSAPKSACEP